MRTSLEGTWKIIENNAKNSSCCCMVWCFAYLTKWKVKLYEELAKFLYYYYYYHYVHIRKYIIVHIHTRTHVHYSSGLFDNNCHNSYKSVCIGVMWTEHKATSWINWNVILHWLYSQYHTHNLYVYICHFFSLFVNILINSKSWIGTERVQRKNGAV